MMRKDKIIFLQKSQLIKKTDWKMVGSVFVGSIVCANISWLGQM